MKGAAFRDGCCHGAARSSWQRGWLASWQRPPSCHSALSTGVRVLMRHPVLLALAGKFSYKDKAKEADAARAEARRRAKAKEAAGSKRPHSSSGGGGGSSGSGSGKPSSVREVARRVKAKAKEDAASASDPRKPPPSKPPQPAASKPKDSSKKVRVCAACRLHATAMRADVYWRCSEIMPFKERVAYIHNMMYHVYMIHVCIQSVLR